MPHINMRISASSSTTRTSCAMDDGPCCCDGWRLGQRSGIAGLGTVEDQHDAGAAAVAVIEDQLAAVIFHDLLDDGETEPGALGARRHIGLGQALAPFGRQAAAIVLDDERDLPVRIVEPHGDLAWRPGAV